MEILIKFTKYENHFRDRQAIIKRICPRRFPETVPYEQRLGYRMLKEYWNKGYATETSKALLQYGFEQLGLKKIVSSAHVDNAASRRVMEKIGLKFKDYRFHYSCRQAYYEMLLGEYVVFYK